MASGQATPIIGSDHHVGDQVMNHLPGPFRQNRKSLSTITILQDPSSLHNVTRTGEHDPMAMPQTLTSFLDDRSTHSEPTQGPASDERREELKGGTNNGGARRDRTDDLMLAKHALSQLSYGPYLNQTRRTFTTPASNKRREERTGGKSDGGPG